MVAHVVSGGLGLAGLERAGKTAFWKDLDATDGYGWGYVERGLKG
jgi:hypothetical protein